MFCIGGFGNWPINSVKKFSSLSSTWISVKSMNFPRFGASATVFDGKLYVAGGDDSQHQLCEFEMYDDASDSWTILPKTISPRYEFHLCIVDDQIFAVGDDNKVHDTMEVYDAIKKKWFRHQFNQDLSIRAQATVSTYLAIK